MTVKSINISVISLSCNATAKHLMLWTDQQDYLWIQTRVADKSVHPGNSSWCITWPFENMEALQIDSSNDKNSLNVHKLHLSPQNMDFLSLPMFQQN